MQSFQEGLEWFAPILCPSALGLLPGTEVEPSPLKEKFWMQSEKNFLHPGQWRKSCIHTLFQSSNFSAPGIVKDVKPTQSFCDPYPLSIKAQKKDWACFPPLWTVSIPPLFQSAFPLLSHLLNNLCQGSATAQIKWPVTTIIQKYFHVSSRFTQGAPASHAAIPHWHTNSSWILRQSWDIHIMPICSLWRGWGDFAWEAGLNGNY